MYKNYASMFLGRDTQLRKEKTTVTGLLSNSWLFGVVLLFGMLFTGFKASAQITVTNPGNTSPPMLGTYGSLAAALVDVNNRTAISGPVTIALSAAETAPAGGYVLNNVAITGGSNTNRFIFDGGGNTITAAVPAGTAGNLNDGFFKIVGADFITIQNFVMNESASNTVTTAASNTMMEWGVALLYASTTNGAQGCVIQGNTITLNRTYQNTFGIYSNSTHSATTVATSVSATTATGGNHGLKVYSNIISNVNNGIVVVGPTAAADALTGLEIGGASLGNTITNYGTTATFSGYANVSGTVNGVLVRNAIGFTISNNTVTSSVGGVTSGTLNGIQVPAASAAPTTTFTNNINSNSISLKSGVIGGLMNGITYPSGSASATSILNVNGNDFNNFGHTVAGTATITFITVSSTNFTTSISSNTFTNMSVNTTGSVTFISNSITAPAGGSQTISNNSIVTGFTKTGAGGTVTGITTGGSSTTVTSTWNANNFSNINVTGATAITFINNTDGGSVNHNITNNTFSNIVGGTSTIIGISSSFGGANGGSGNLISGNTVRNISSAGAITGINIGSSGTTSTVTGNTVNTLSSSGASLVVGITSAAPTSASISKNKIYDLSSSNASGTVSGIAVTSGTLHDVSNNIIGDLRATAANAANPLNGLNITGGTTVNVYYNTVNINGASSGALFGSSAISASTTPTLRMNNNIFRNASTANGAGLAVAYRRSSATLTSYATTSNRNDFFASTIYTDGTVPNTFAVLAPYKALMVSPRDENSLNVNPTFLSTVSGDANFLKIDTTVATQLESGGATVAGINDDFENDFRFGHGSYAGTGTAPDMGADEFEGIPASVCSGAPAAALIVGATSVCSGKGTTLSLDTVYTDLYISYQWNAGTTPGVYDIPLGTGITQATGNLTVPMYYQCVITCDDSGFSTYTDEKSVTIDALPTVTVSPTTASFCKPGGTPINLTADGAVSYTWSGTNAGLSATTGTSVVSTPTASTVVTVEGTDGLGCKNTATSTITVSTYPTGVTATATPAVVCSGAASSLTGTANTASPTVANLYTFAGSTGTYTTITGTTLGASAIGDDVGIGNLPIGFSFNYNGGTETVFGASSNGFIRLGDTAATLSGGSANALASNAKIIAAFWEDNNTTGGSIIYATTGSVGSRVLTVQWTGMQVGGGGATGQPSINVQIKLYEGSNKVEFVYGSTSAALTSTTASIGISGVSGNFISVTPTSATSPYATTSIVTENTSITSATNIPSGTIYSFSPESLSFTYAWTAATNLVSPSTISTATTALSATETFTLTVSNNGCDTTAQTSVTISASAPTVSVTPAGPISLCGAATQVLTANPVGASPFHYAWTLDGNPVGGDTATLTTSGSGNYAVTVTDACTLPSTASNTVAVTVYSIPTATISGSASVCQNETSPIVTFTGTGGVSPYTFTYSLNGAADATIVSTGDVATIVIPTTTAATYSYVLKSVAGQNCSQSQSGTVTVTVKPQPSAVTVTPATTTICSGQSVALVASGGTVGGAANATLGNGVGLTGATAQPTAFCNRWAQYWNQTIYTVTELQNAGLTAGSTISSVTYTTTSQGDASNNTNFSIRIANTASSTLSAFQTTGFTTVFGPTSYTHVIGTNTITFSTPFVWNGTSNIILDVLQDGVDNLNNAITTFTAASDNKNFEAHTSTTSSTTPIQTLVANASVTGTASTTRLNIVLAYSTIVNPTWQWTPPSSGLDVYTGANVNATPSGTTTYTATATVNGCSNFNTAAVNVTANSTPTVALTSSDADNTFAYGTTVTFTANAGSLGGGTASYDFKVNGNSVQNGASNTYVVSTANANNLANGNQVSVVITVTGGTCLTSPTATSNTITNTVTGSYASAISTYCGQTMPAIDAVIKCTVPTGVVGTLAYRFKVKNNITNTTVNYDSAVPNFRLTATSVYAYATSFNVQVAPLVNGLEQPFSAVCVITTPAIPLNQIGPCTQTLTSLSDRIFANYTIFGAQLYRFRVAESTAPTTYYYATSVGPNSRLTSLVGLPAGFLNFGKTYLVSVQSDLTNNGIAVTTSYDAPCTVNTPAVTAVNVTANQCGQQLVTILDRIYVNAVPNAVSYNYRVKKGLAGTEYDFSSPYTNFRLSNVVGLSLTYESDYYVSVQSVIRIDGIDYLSNFSTACDILTPDFPTVSLQESQCSDGNLENPGPYMVPTTATPIYCEFVSGATYEFSLQEYDGENPVGPALTSLVRPTNNFTLHQVTGVEPNKVYLVSVTLTSYGVGPIGHSCVIQSPAAAREIAPEVGGNMKVEFSAMAYPNPFANNFVIDVKTRNESAVSVKVYDMIGRLVEQKSANVSDLQASPIGDNYPSGVYNVVVTQGEDVRTVRVVKR